MESRLVVAKEGGDKGGMDWEFEISRGKLLHIPWINNKDLLNSTGNYIQYPVINHDGKECEKEYRYCNIYVYIYMYIWASKVAKNLLQMQKTQETPWV